MAGNVLGSFFDWLLRWGNVISGFGSVLFSAVLAYLYLKMKKTQEERTKIHRDQTDIQNNQHDLLESQKELMKVGHSPNVQVDAYGANSEEAFQEFSLLLSNIGKGFSTDISIRIEPMIDHLDLYKSETVHAASNVDREADDMIDTRDNYLLPGESEIEFKAQSAIYMSEYEGEIEHPAAFEYATEMVSDQGENKLRLKLNIIYTDTFRETHEHEFADIVVPVKGRTLFELAMQYSIPYEHHKEHDFALRDALNEIEKDSAYAERES